MAKTSMVNRDVKRAKLAKQHGAKRDALKKIISSPTASYEEKMEAVRQAAEAAARFLGMPPAQPLRDDRPSAWRLREVRPGPQHAAQGDDARRRPGPPQGVLVTLQHAFQCGATKYSQSRGYRCTQRYYSMSMTDPIADMLVRIENAAAVGKPTV